MRSILLVVLLVFSSFSPSESQILDRLRRRAEDAVGEASVLQRLLEEPPGITTSIRDAHTEVPFLDDHNPTSTALMAALPRTAGSAFYAPPGLYEMEALSYCIHAGTYGPTGGHGYALAPLQGDLAPVLRTLMRTSLDHPEIAQRLIQSLIWALQSKAPINELSPELQAVARALLTPAQLDRLSEGVVNLAKEAFMAEALERVPESVRRVAELEAEMRELLRRGADFEELEAVAVLVGAPSLEQQVREVPVQRWNYHPDGYFIRFAPEGYTLTHIEVYVPERYRLSRDRQGRVGEVLGPRETRVIFEYGNPPSESRRNLASLKKVRLIGIRGTEGVWDVEGWTFVGNDMGGGPPDGTMAAREWEARREAARDLRRQTRDVITSARGSDAGRPGVDLADLSHLRTSLLEARAQVSDEVLIHLANAWQYALCVEAGGCAGPRMAMVELPEENWIQQGVGGPVAGAPSNLHGPMAGVPLNFNGPMAGTPVSFYEPVPGTPLLQSGGGGGVDPGGNVAAPGNTGSQRLLQSGKTPTEKANLAMKALSVFLALADVLSSSGLGSAAYNALGLGGLPVGHLGLPTMMAGAMISQVTNIWSSATDALAGDTGGGNSGGDDGGDSGGGDEGSGSGDAGSGTGSNPNDPNNDTDLDDPPGGGGGGWEDARSDGQDYENTPPPSPPPNPSPPPPGSDMSPGRTAAYNDFSDALFTTLYHTQGLADSQLRQEAAAQAGAVEWAQTQADLAAEHQQQAAQGMMEVAGALEALLDVAGSEGLFQSGYADAEELAGVQERLRSQGWSSQEMQVAGALRITPAEMEELRGFLISQDPEVMAGDLNEAARLWAKEMRTAGILWMALSGLGGG